MAQSPLSQRDWDDAHLINAARDIHADDPAFGYRFIADELPSRGITAGENRVARLCSQDRIWSIFANKRGTEPPIRPASPTCHLICSLSRFGGGSAWIDPRHTYEQPVLARGRTNTPLRRCPRTHRRGPSNRVTRCATLRGQTFVT